MLATRELTDDVGYTRVTIEAIAARAGVGKQTIYRWWPSKGAVVFDAILDGNADADGEQVIPDTGDLRRDLRTLARAVTAELACPKADRLNRTVIAEIQSDEALAQDLVRRLLRPQFAATVARLGTARAAGQFAIDVDVEVAVEILFGSMFYRWLLRTGPLDSAYADQLVDLVLAGFDPRETHRPRPHRTSPASPGT